MFACVIRVLMKILKGKMMLGDTEVCSEGPNLSQELYLHQSFVSALARIRS